MPSGPRIRTDNVFGTLTDNPLSNVATTMNSAGLANLAAVSSAHAVIVLDPLRAAGAPEIVFVTAHTGAATSATIARGKYGTSAREHAAGVLWVHAPTVEDAIRIVTSGTRPSDPYEGQLIYETDTDSYKGYNGSAWEHGLTLGAWGTWTPTLTQSATVTKTVNEARFQKVGRTVSFSTKLTVTGTGTAANGIRLGLPVAMVNGDERFVGGGQVFDTSTSSLWRAFLVTADADEVFLSPTDGTVSNVLGATGFTAALASGDVIVAYGTFEAAS